MERRESGVKGAVSLALHQAQGKREPLKSTEQKGDI